MPKRRFLILGGRVHGVGYRVLLINSAIGLGIDRMAVYNAVVDGREAVIALVDGTEDQLREFSRVVREERPKGASVSEVIEEDYEGVIPPIERTMSAFQMEHWGKAIPILLDVRDGIKRVEAAVREEGQLIKEALSEDLRREIEEIKKRLDRLESMVG